MGCDQQMLILFCKFFKNCEMLFSQVASYKLDRPVIRLILLGDVITVPLTKLVEFFEKIISGGKCIFHYFCGVFDTWF